MAIQSCIVGLLFTCPIEKLYCTYVDIHAGRQSEYSDSPVDIRIADEMTNL